MRKSTVHFVVFGVSILLLAAAGRAEAAVSTNINVSNNGEGSESNVSVNNSVHSNSSTTITNGSSHSCITINGKTECHDGNGSYHYESDDGHSKVDINNNTGNNTVQHNDSDDDSDVKATAAPTATNAPTATPTETPTATPTTNEVSPSPAVQAEKITGFNLHSFLAAEFALIKHIFGFTV
jgi:hypothetical protein